MAIRAGYKQTEVGVIPEDWDVYPVSYFGETKRGAGSLSIKYARSGGIRLIRINDFFQDNPVFVEPTDDIMRFQLHERDLLFAGTGASAGASFLPKKEWIGLPHSYNAPRIRVFEGKSKEYLLFSLKSDYVLKQQRAWFVGNAQPFLDTKAISSFSIALPSTLTEQEAIAAALSDADALIAALEGLIAKKRQIKQGTMQELMTGKRRLPGFSEEWNEVPLGEFIEFSKGQSLSKSKLVENGKRKCILYGELFTTYDRVINDVISSTNSEDGILSISGDILMPGSTTTSGIDLAVASALMVDDVALGGDVNILRSKNAIKYSSEFLANYLTHVARNSIAEVTQGTTIHHLYGKSLKNITVKIPECPEQTAIAEILSDMDAEIEMLAAKLSKARQVKQGMMSELLTGRIRLV